MSNLPLMFQPLAKYADFQDRSRRSEFWLWVLFRVLLGSAISTIMGSVMISSLAPLMSQAHPDPQVFMTHYFGSIMTVTPIFSLINLALLVPSLAVGVRRLHDIGRTGWWLVMPCGVALVGLLAFFVVCGSQIFDLASHGDNVSDAEGVKFALTLIGSVFLCVVLPMLVAEIVMLVFYVTEGERRPNRFGPDPKGAALNDTP